MKTLLETIGSMDEYKDGWPCVTEFKMNLFTNGWPCCIIKIFFYYQNFTLNLTQYLITY